MNPNPSGNDDDSHLSLLDIATRYNKPIVSLLADIQEYRVRQDKYLAFIENLECLVPDANQTAESPITLSRKRINAFDSDSRDYVALSYTCRPSRFEPATAGGYRVQTRDNRALFFESPVRDCVLDRAVGYMRAVGVGPLWIDSHSIRQRTQCQRPVCGHPSCTEKRSGIQAMDLVYKLSNYPVALLGRPVASAAELDLLAAVLQGRLVVEDEGPARFRPADRRQALRALALLDNITADDWWRRAWTYQENYRGGWRMKLLIRHDPALEKQKRAFRRLFCHPVVAGELCVSSVSFCSGATRICLALKNIANRLSRHQQAAVDRVIDAAARFTVLLDKSTPLTPAVVAGVVSRGVTDCWDRLAIAANCCQYPVRLDIESLRTRGHSLSLSMLALCLLNGEVLHNGRRELTSEGATVPEYLSFRIFDEICRPEREAAQTFGKECRFPSVRFDDIGVRTEGQLWRLGEIIETARFRDEDTRGLGRGRKKQLNQLARRLRASGHVALAEMVNYHLKFVTDVKQINQMPFLQKHMHLMAWALADAVKAGKPLRLGRLSARSEESRQPYGAIFIWGDADPESDPWFEHAAFAFTASSPEHADSQQHHDANDIDRHVSFEADLEAFTRGRVPVLRLRRWLLGLYSFEAQPADPAVFPWPPSLKDIEPRHDEAPVTADDCCSCRSYDGSSCCSDDASPASSQDAPLFSSQAAMEDISYFSPNTSLCSSDANSPFSSGNPSSPHVDTSPTSSCDGCPASPTDEVARILAGLRLE